MLPFCFVSNFSFFLLKNIFCCWIPLPSSTVTKRETIFLVLLFCTAQPCLSYSFLQRATAAMSVQAPLQSQSPCSAAASSFLCSQIIGFHLKTHLNVLAYHVIMITPSVASSSQFTSLPITVLSSHFLSNELRLFLNMTTCLSLVVVLTLPHLEIKKKFCMASSLITPFRISQLALTHNTILIQGSTSL